MHALPKSGFVRLKTLIGDPKADPPIPAIIPVSKSTFWKGVKEGRYPQPTRALGHRITAWSVESIKAYLESAVASDPTNLPETSSGHEAWKQKLRARKGVSR